MKVHTNKFKDNIKLHGKELDSKITYTIDNEQIVLSSEEINSIVSNYKGNILKSVMKELDIDCNIGIPAGTIVNYKFGLKVDNGYEYLDFGNYIVYSTERQEDTNSYKIICYDKMIYSMKTNENLNITYPISVRDYIKSLCNRIGLTFSNAESEFANYDKTIPSELYLGLDYTYRDILDELAQVTASTICINTNDELEIRYINNTNDIINEEYLKDVNINFGVKYGPINSVVLSRSAESDNVFLKNEESIASNGLCEIKIKDNQIMNWNNRSDFLPDILERVNGIEYYINDFESPGICYYDICDKYNVQIGSKLYSCLMLNNEINVTQGLVENIYTEEPNVSQTDYNKADKTDRRINQTWMIVDKQEQYIEQLVSDMYDDDGIINENFTNIFQDINNIVNSVQNSGGSNLIKNSVMFAYDDKNIPNDWIVEGTGTLSINSSAEALASGSNSGHVFTLLNKKVKQRISVKVDSDAVPENEKVYYTFSTKIKKDATGTCYVKLYNSNEEHVIELNEGQSSFYGDYEIKALLPKDNYYDIEFYGSEDSNATFTDNMFAVGEYKTQWQQANGEIMNTQVNINVNGVLVKSSVYLGDYTVMSPLEFAGYSNLNGVVTKVFSLNKDVTLVKKLEAEDEIKMTPIKIVPITTGDLQGWAFVPSTGGGN